MKLFLPLLKNKTSCDTGSNNKMNLESIKSISGIFIIVFIGLPWVFGCVFLGASWFGNGFSSGSQAKQMVMYRKLILDCESNLKRDEFCHLVAKKKAN